MNKMEKLRLIKFKTLNLGENLNARISLFKKIWFPDITPTRQVPEKNSKENIFNARIFSQTFKNFSLMRKVHVFESNFKNYNLKSDENDQDHFISHFMKGSKI